MTRASATNIDHAPPQRAALRLRLLATTDLHGHLTGYDYTCDRPSPETGLVRLAALIAQARNEAPNCLLFDNGDFLQGSPLVDYWARERGLAEGELHPMIGAMNALGYDAVTVGNHEFNFGLDFLLRALEGAHFPIVCANALTVRGPDPAQDVALFAPWTVIEREVSDDQGHRHRLRIGVIGLLPPQTVQWDRAVLGGALHTRGIVAAARAALPRIRAAGVDLVVALAHTGVEAQPDSLGEAEAQENAALALAALDGIDALICGHTHEAFPVTSSTSSPAPADLPGFDAARGTLMGKPAVMAGRWGSHLGLVDLDLQPRAEGGWRVAGAQSSLRGLTELPPDENTCGGYARDVALCEACQPAHLETLNYIRRDLGHLARPVQSFFSLVAPDAGLSLIAEVQAEHVAERLAGQPEAALPLISAVAPYRCGGRGGPGYFVDLPAGPLRQRAVASLYVYPNTVTAVQVSGADVIEWLERSAAAFCTLTPGASDQPLLDADFPCYNFDVMFGLDYEIDPSQPPRYDAHGRLVNRDARRIRNLRHRGAAVEPRARFVVATNNYRNSGAGGFVEAAVPPLDLGAEVTSQAMLTEALRRRSEVAPKPVRNWRFAALPGTSALFDTAPQARGRLDEAAPVQIEECGPTPEGFLRVRLQL